MSKKLYMMVGIPRCGKSTYARTLGAPIVSPDAVREALNPGVPFTPALEPYVWAVSRTMVEALFHAGHPSVILDATNVSRKRRDAWKSPRWSRSFIVFPIDRDLVMERAKRTEFPTDVIERMIENFEPPTLEELEEWDDKEINYFHREQPLGMRAED